MKNASNQKLFSTRLEAKCATSSHHFLNVETVSNRACSNFSNRAFSSLKKSGMLELSNNTRTTRQIIALPRPPRCAMEELRADAKDAGRDAAVGDKACRRLVGRRHDGRSAKFRHNVARFRPYRHQSLQVSTRFSAFFKICKII